jgi:uncharacterized membrane-anchored protein YjiN (DUF445 family)
MNKPSEKVDEYLKKFQIFIMPIIQKVHDNEDLENRENKLRNLFLDFSEIKNTLETLIDYEVYIRRFPYSKTRIVRTRHFKNTVANYLNEIYILKNRLISYLTKIERSIKDTKARGKVHKAFVPYYEFISETFKSIVHVRGEHVHDKRYDTKELNLISMIEYMCTEHDPDVGFHYNDLLNERYNEVKKEWTKYIETNNSLIVKLIDSYCDVLIYVMFKADFIRCVA